MQENELLHITVVLLETVNIIILLMKFWLWDLVLLTH